MLRANAMELDLRDFDVAYAYPFCFRPGMKNSLPPNLGLRRWAPQSPSSAGKHNFLRRKGYPRRPDFVVLLETFSSRWPLCACP